MRQFGLLLAVIGLMICGCGQQQVAKKSWTIDELDIFNKEHMSSIMANDNAKQKKAIELYNSGLQKYRKDKDATGAIGLFTTSIKTHPDPKTYFELGNAYATNKDYQTALKCYDMAEQLGYSPVSKLFYNMACACAQLNGSDEANKYIEYAIEAGFMNKEQLKKDPDLNNIRHAMFEYTFESALEGVESAHSVVWNAFLQSFKTLVLPVTVDLKSEKQLNLDVALSFEDERYVTEMHEREKFSRGGGDLFYALGTVEKNKNYVSLIYAQAQDYELTGEAPAVFFLVSYDLSGTIFDKMQIAGQKSSAELAHECTIKSNLEFEVKDIEVQYKHPIDEYSGEPNEVVSSNVKTTRHFKINDAGKFVEAGMPLGFVTPKSAANRGS